MRFYLFLTILAGCGAFEPRYEPYAASSATSQATEEDPCVTAALAAFADAIAPVIDGGSCSCHSAIQPVNLRSGQNAQNRNNLLTYIGSPIDPNVLFDFIASGQHQGGNKSGELPLAVITTWTDAELQCESGANQTE